MDQPDMKAILIVEDDASIRETLAYLFRERGYQVFGAENGVDALSLLGTMPKPCIILLDLFMPIMNGAEFLTRLRQLANPIIATLPVVVVSAAPPDGDIARSVAAETSGFIKKPFDLDGLLATVERYC